ncbi:MAG: tyrosine-type recombinase/integrase [Oscillospiraceae bacterium]
MPNKSTVNEFLQEWLQTYVQPTRKPSTYDGYVKIIDRYIKHTIGNVYLCDLSSIMVQRFINSLSKSSTVSDNPLSPKTIRNIFNLLNCAMKKAVDLNLISKSPTENIELPKRIKYNGDVWDSEDIKKALSVAKGTDMETPLMILLGCGIRRGELLSLTWKDIDFKNRTININKNLVQTPNNKILTQTPKTQAGIRSIPMPNALYEHLKEKYEKLKENENFSEEDYLVYLKTPKKPYRPDVFSQKFQRFIANNNLKKIRLHDTRHTFCSIMLRANTPMKAMQNLMGHSDCSCINDIYAHITKDLEEDTTKKIDELIFG